MTSHQILNFPVHDMFSVSQLKFHLNSCDDSIPEGKYSRTLNPTCTGTSVLAICYDNGICIAADTLCSYGSLARYTNVSRIMKVNNSTILGATGDYADYQYLKSIIEQKVINDYCLNDGSELKPSSLHCWLTRILYNRRSKFDPLWNQLIVGGLQDDQPYLGFIDKIGTAYQSPHIATGYGAYLALPMMRTTYEGQNLNESEAKQLLQNCLKVLFYRDARSYHTYEIAIVNTDGVKFEEPCKIESNWDIANVNV